MKAENKIKNDMQKNVKVPEIVEDRIQEAFRKILEEEIYMKNGRTKDSFMGNERMKDDITDRRRRISRNARKKKHGRKNGQKNYRNALWISMAAAACLVFILTGIVFTNPALAKELPFIGSLFEQFERKAEQDPYKKDKTAYKEIAEHAKKPETSENTAADGGITATDAGITITASETYYDGYNLYFTLALTTEAEAYKEADGFNMLRYKEGDSIPFPANAIINGTPAEVSLLQFKKGEDGTFICFVQVYGGSIPEGTADNVQTAEGQTEVSIECNALGVHLESDTTVYQNFTDELKASKVIEGNWNLNFRVSVDSSNNETVEPETEGNGFIVKKAVKTPSNFIISVLIPVEWAERNPSFQIFDASGNKVDLMMGRKITVLEDGSVLQEWVAEHTDAGEFVLKVFDKNGSADELIQIAEIPFSF